MKTIFRIAKAELLNLFYSPVAWSVIIIYFIVCGLRFTIPMENLFRIQKVFLESDPKWVGFDVRGLTIELTGAVLDELVANFYLFIPLLTMGVINREVNSGTMKLLYSSPIRTRDIVFGKYLGLLLLVMILVIFVAIFLVSASLIIKDPEINRHFASLLGVFLLGNAYIAIGLFISCVTNYQIVAGLLTYVVFFILGSISGLWQQYDFFRDLTYFLSISGRSNNLLDGLISTRDLFYFILIIILFLGFSLINLRSTQESKPWSVSFAKYITLFIIVLFFGYITARPGQVAYWDLTRNKTNTIHPKMQGVLKELDGSPLTITLYTNLFGGPTVVHGLPQNRNFYLWQFWEQYRRFYPEMNFRFVYYYDIMDGDMSLFTSHPKKNLHQIAEKFAKELGIRKSIFLTPEEIRKQIDLGKEKTNLVMQVEYKGKKEWLRTYRDGNVWPGPENIAGTITRLVRDSVPKLLFTTGHYERGPYKNYNYNTLATVNRASLINLGVDADTISLGSSEIPPATSALIVADPRSQLNPGEEEKIKSYLQNGGNALILAEVKKQQMVNPILNSIGVNIDNGTIVHPNNHEMPHILNANLTRAGGFLAEEESFYQYQRGARKELGNVIEGGANISYEQTAGFKIEPIIELNGNERTWIENGILVVDSAAPILSVTEGDIQHDKYVLGIKLTRIVNNKEQRVIVTGDADMLTQFRNNLGNSLYSWILKNEYPFYMNYPARLDTLFTVRKGTIKVLSVASIYVIPGILLVLAVVLLLRRKRK